MIRLLAMGALALAFSHAVRADEGKPAPVPADPAATMFKAWDRNGDAQLSLTEFRAGWQQTQALAKARAALGRQFATIDANHDRAIDASEYRNLLLVKKAGNAAPPLARFDADRNGRLEFAEYVNLVETLTRPQPAREDARK